MKSAISFHLGAKLLQSLSSSPPSERTTPTRKQLNLLRFFPNVTTESYYSVLGACSCIVLIGHRQEVVERLAPIKRHDLVHAAAAELLAVGLRDVEGRHLRVRPAEHRHHLALGALGISRHFGARLADPMAALLELVEAGQHRVLLNFIAQAFLFSTRPLTRLPVKTSAPILPAARAARR